MEYVIVKRADGVLELRQKDADFKLGENETLVSMGSTEGAEFLEAQAAAVENEKRSQAALRQYAEGRAAQATPAGRVALPGGADFENRDRGTGAPTGGVAVLDGNGQPISRTDGGGAREAAQVFEARRGLGLEVYTKMSARETRAGTEHFAEFVWRLKNDPVFTRQRIEMAKRLDRNLTEAGGGIQRDAQLDENGQGGLGTGVDFKTRALAEGTTSAGGALVPPQYIQEILDIARSEAAAFAAGVQMRQTDSNLIFLPTLATAATASWVSENQAITPTDQTFGQQSGTVSKIGAGGKLSNEVIADADPSILEVVQGDLAKVIALCLDLGIFEGSGTAPVIRGIANTGGVTAGGSLGANGGTPTLDVLYDTMYALNAANIFDEDQWSVVFHPRALNSLRKIKDTTNNYILSSAQGVNAPVYRPRGLMGLPYFMSTQLSIARTVGTNSDCTNIYLGRFREMIAFMSGGFTLDLSTDAADATNSAFWSDQTWIRAKQRVGFLVRRPAGIAVITGVRP